MTDTERLDKLEALIWSNKVGNGLVIFPSRNSKTGVERVCLQDLGDEDGSNLGEELTDLKPTIREAIDALS
jgi:hypothetical protein